MIRTTRISIRISLLLAALSAEALFVSNLALTDIQHGNGKRLEWAIMHVSYAIFILFHLSAIVSFIKILRSHSARENGTLMKRGIET